MVRLNLLVEGQTEEAFVKRVLGELLADQNVYAYPQIVSTRRKGVQIRRGGVRHYERIRRDLKIWMKSDQRTDVCFTTMFDLYHLPQDFPGFNEASKKTAPFERVAVLENAFRDDIGPHRFIPYIQLHEFEALLLADPQKLDWEFIEHGQAIRKLRKFVEGYPSPEEINDGQDTAPSKQIIKEIPEYKARKVSTGPLVASKIGLDVIRQKCPHFNDWLSQLERLGRGQDG